MSSSYGRVKVDEHGVCQRPFLFLFGETFEVAWSDILSWSWTESVLSSRTSEQVIARLIHIEARHGWHYTIHRSGSDLTFPALVDEFRRRLPDKETASKLTRRSPDLDG